MRPGRLVDAVHVHAAPKLAAACLGYSRGLLRWPWQQAGAAAVAVIAAISQTAGVHHSLLVHLTIFVFALAVDLLLLCSLMWLLWERDEQIAQHRQALAELSAANRRLEATIAENEGLHRQLLVQAREAGTLDERRRMAREIHDTLAQGLAGIVPQLQAADNHGHPQTGVSGPQKQRSMSGSRANDLCRQGVSSHDVQRPTRWETTRIGAIMNRKDRCPECRRRRPGARSGMHLRRECTHLHTFDLRRVHGQRRARCVPDRKVITGQSRSHAGTACRPSPAARP